MTSRPCPSLTPANVQAKWSSRQGISGIVDASGVELYARRSWDDHFGVYGGINWRDAEDTGVDSSADLEQYLLGVDYRRDKRTVV